MFTSAYNEWIALEHPTNDNSNAQVTSTSVELARRSIEMFLFQFDRVNESTDTNTSQPVLLLDYPMKLLPILNKHLDNLMNLSIEDYFNSITRHQYSKEKNINKTITL